MKSFEIDLGAQIRAYRKKKEAVFDRIVQTYRDCGIESEFNRTQQVFAHSHYPGKDLQGIRYESRGFSR